MNYSPADQIKNFLNYLETSGKNNLTIQNYQLYLKRFFDWLNKEKLSLDKIDYLAIQKYSRWLLGPAHSLKNNTVDYHLIALRSFSRYLKKTNQSGPTETDIKLNNAKTNESAWENDPADSLRQTIQQQTGAELIKLRDLCLVELLLNYGLKVSEISHLNKADLNLFKDQLTIRKNNSDETRTLTINSDTKLAINNYLSKRHDTDPALFINHDRAATAGQRQKKFGHNLSNRSIQRLISNYALKLGWSQKITPTYLRKIYSQRLAKKNTNPRLAKNLLGYKHLNSLKIYWPNQSAVKTKTIVKQLTKTNN